MMQFARKLNAATALASISLLSSFMTVNSDDIVPLKSLDDVSISVDGNNIITTKVHVVDPWIRPPRGVATQQALGLAGDFDLYPRITATGFDRIRFNMRPIAREGTNTQRHGVYVITDKQLVRDYLDGNSEHPCGEPVYTEEKLCQVVEYQGLNATDCPARKTLFPLLEIFGSSGDIEYTAYGLSALAESYGVETKTGSKVLAFDCPWIQGRNDEGSGRTSHCIGGMYLIVEVLPEAEVFETSVKSDATNYFLLLSPWATLVTSFLVYQLFHPY